MTIRATRSYHPPLFASLAMLAIFSVPCAALAQEPSAPPATSAGQNGAPDNSGQNKRHHKTAQQQPENTNDRMTTKKVRQAIVADKSLSMYGHNIKIITQGGSVTLKGPVKSEEEKQAIGAKAAEAAGGADKVTNELTVKQ